MVCVRDEWEQVRACSRVCNVLESRGLDYDWDQYQAIWNFVADIGEDRAVAAAMEADPHALWIEFVWNCMKEKAA